MSEQPHRDYQDERAESLKKEEERLKKEEERLKKALIEYLLLRGIRNCPSPNESLQSGKTDNRTVT